MTKRSVYAPNQVKFIAKLTENLHCYPYVFVNDDEMTHGAEISEGSWLTRVNDYVNSAGSGVGSDPYDRELAIAVITRMHKHYINKRVVAKLTKILNEPIKQKNPLTKLINDLKNKSKTNKLEKLNHD
jgi:hypothetical protein